MRVIAGEFRSRKLKALPGMDTRPTPDRLRETLFNILAPRLADCVFLDAYAGTGAVGIEALSRGARRAIFVDRARGAAEIIRENLRMLGIQSRAEVFTGKALTILERLTADIVFLDPPYERESEYGEALQRLGVKESAGLVIAQHHAKLALDDAYGHLRKVRTVKQGDNVLSFYEAG
ncbi:MAG: 16S rRNA (guanine(966)-N(2))-methyltransferase RsmD [Acidobacteriota bacterium]|nr:16S rRNA (guanine(966)-N(2))-methyltransferase RsmD [Acidobacteriota bacterium]